MSLKEWLMAHLPEWLIPFNRWGGKGRPDMPEKHAVLNKQQELSLRGERAQSRARLAGWREQRRDG